MPQMAPLNWTMLFIYFIIIFFSVNVLNYFSFIYPVKFKKITKKLIQINWKW
uniref:ATP synthase complex subunit 8 n=1 Tax=Erotylinae sp. 4 ACP-2013 TaxID=1434615 RepID=A0A3G3FXF2_9CUCU|nr:ATP synthase F0 subunit 8 [Erotylinae sp. 4 ACP-2013]